MKKILILISILVVCTISINSVFAFYNIKKEKTENMVVAMPIITIREGNKIEINNEKLSGIYEFSVRNYKGLKVNQAELIYEIQIKVNNTNVENIKLAKVIKNNEIEQELVNQKTKGYILKATNKQEDKYKLYISYKNTKYSNSVEDTLKINIKTIQNILREGA